jgi:predicted ester cyclase
MARSGGTRVSVAENKALVQRFIEQVFVGGDRDAVDALVTPDFVSHGLPGSGPDVMKGAIERTSKGLSGASMDVQDIIGEGDRVAVRMMSSATQTGELMGMPPSGKTYTIEELHEFRVADGRIAEHWHQMDSMGMMKQLGAMPGQSKS